MTIYHEKAACFNGFSGNEVRTRTLALTRTLTLTRTLNRSPYERRQPITICRVHVEARRSQQRRDRLGVASIRRPHEHRPSITICRVHVQAFAARGVAGCRSL